LPCFGTVFVILKNALFSASKINIKARKMKNAIISKRQASQLKISIVFITISSLLACSGSRNTSSRNKDDVYYSSSDARSEREAAPRNSSSPDYTPPASSQFDNNSQNSRANDNGGGNQVTNNYYGDSFDYDDYYDYSYSSRIRRFHRPYNGFGYYDPIYTNVYYYDYDPFFWGNSIYLGYNWWAPVSVSYMNCNPGWGWGGGWYRPWYRPWVYTNSWYYGSVWGGWWNDPWAYNSWGWGGGWGNPYRPAFGWGGGWGNPYWSGYAHGFNNGYWAGYQQASWDNFYYNSYDPNTYYYGRRGSASATGGSSRRSFASNFEQAQAVDNGRYNRFTPASQVTNSGGLQSQGRPSDLNKPATISSGNGNLQSGRPVPNSNVTVPSNPVNGNNGLNRPGTTQTAGNNADVQQRPGGTKDGNVQLAPSQNFNSGNQVKDRVQGQNTQNGGYSRPVSPEWVRPSVTGNTQTSDDRPSVINNSPNVGYSRPSSEVYTRPQTPSSDNFSNRPSGQSQTVRPSGNFNTESGNRPAQGYNQQGPADDYYSRPSRQDGPTQNYSSPRGNYQRSNPSSVEPRSGNRSDYQPSRSGRDYSPPSNSRPGSDFSRPQPSRPNMDAPRPSNRGGSYQAPSGGGTRVGGSVAPARSAPSGGGFSGGGRSGGSSSGSRGGSSVGGRR
jgi:hypothetical protein